jgi:hypothetical protein
LVAIIGGLVIFAIIIVGILSPLISLFFLKKGFKKAWMTTNIILLGVLLFIIAPIQILSYYTEEKPVIDKMDKQYQDSKEELPKGNSIDKIFVEFFKTGTSSNKGNRLCNILINNYNNQDFKGILKVKAVYEGKTIGEEKVKIFLLANEKGYSDYIYAYELNIDRTMWENVIFEYELKGEFSKN